MRVTETQQANHRRQRSTVGNSTYPKGGVSCSKDNFVGNQTLVLRMNICDKNRHLRQARKRYQKVCGDSIFKEKY
jgi:hypothetical protein